jgi:hypothetical protein
MLLIVRTAFRALGLPFVTFLSFFLDDLRLSELVPLLGVLASLAASDSGTARNDELSARTSFSDCELGFELSDWLRPRC